MGQKEGSSCRIKNKDSGRENNRKQLTGCSHTHFGVGLAVGD